MIASQVEFNVANKSVHRDAIQKGNVVRFNNSGSRDIISNLLGTSILGVLNLDTKPFSTLERDIFTLAR
jgi:hypothetical protein